MCRFDIFVDDSAAVNLAERTGERGGNPQKQLKFRCPFTRPAVLGDLTPRGFEDLDQWLTSLVLENQHFAALVLIQLDRSNGEARIEICTKGPLTLQHPDAIERWLLRGWHPDKHGSWNARCGDQCAASA
jgi:hypothetical protein